MRCSMRVDGLIILNLFFALAFMGCSEQTAKDASQHNPAKQHIEAPEVIADSIVDLTTFAYYAPSNALDGRGFPVIVFFDPQGEGAVPVRAYRSLADSLNLVLVGSNVSKNGVEMSEISDHYDELIVSLRRMFPKNAKRSVLVGFSGGAKVAMQIGLADPSVLGVIANGAMTETKGQRPDMPLALIAGKGDMNHGSMLMSSLQMIQDRPQTVFMQFDGGHEWATEETLVQPLCWILTKAGFGTDIDREELIKTLAMTTQNSKGLDEFIGLRALTTMYSDLPEAEPMKSRLQLMAASGELSDALNAFYESLDGEEARKQDYVQRMQKGDLNWWKSEIERLKNSSKGTSEEAFLSQRLLGFIGLFCYMSAEQLISQSDPAASGIVDIYLLAEPNNPEALRMRRQLDSGY